MGPNKLSTVWVLAYPLLSIAYAITFLIPSKNTVWIFGYNGGTSFTDNSKYLYLHTAQNCDDIRSVWLSKNDELIHELRRNGYEAHHFYSITGTYLSLRSGYGFITHTRKDLPWWCTGNTEIVRLGHGIPFKKYGWAERSKLASESRLRILAKKHIFKNCDYSISTSESTRPLVAEATAVPSDNVFVTGLPRLDAFSDRLSDTEIWTNNGLLNQLEVLSESKRILFYFPTWRRGRSNPFPSNDLLGELDGVLAELDAVMIVQNHPNSDRIPDSEFSNIIAFSGGKDFYPSVELVDSFITDYSSLYYDFLYHGSDIIFYPYDIDEYLSKRELYFEYDELPGRIAETEPEFFESIEKSIGDEPPSTHIVESTTYWKEYAFDHTDHRNCQRVVSAIVDTM